VPDDADLSVMGARIRVVAFSSKDKGVVLDENDDPFEKSEYRFLYTEFGDWDDEDDVIAEASGVAQDNDD
jgi:hypothetical protein